MWVVVGKTSETEKVKLGWGIERGLTEPSIAHALRSIPNRGISDGQDRAGDASVQAQSTGTHDHLGFIGARIQPDDGNAFLGDFIENPQPDVGLNVEGCLIDR